MTAPEPETPDPQPIATSGELSAWVVQLGSFSDRGNADALVKTLRSEGFTAYTELLERDGSVSHRVRVGPQMTRESAEEISQRIASEYKMESVVMRYRGPDAGQ